MPIPEELTRFWSASGFSQKRRFEEAARGWIRLPQPGEDPLDYLLPEAVWQELLNGVDDQAGWLMALSAATGVYFFPSREWPPLFIKYLRILKVGRLLEAGAGRGYVTAALAPLAEEAGMSFKAIDKGEGEFQNALPVYAGVEPGNVFALIEEFRPDAVLYAWPPPGQSLAPLLHSRSLRYLIVIGEKDGGAAGAREDWRILPHKPSPALNWFSRGRTGPQRHQVTVFCAQR
jgi:hypothetical protein